MSRCLHWMRKMVRWCMMTSLSANLLQAQGLANAVTAAPNHNEANIRPSTARDKDARGAPPLFPTSCKPAPPALSSHCLQTTD